ncbi:MAG: PAS domain S-box protein [Acidobacteriota bacterium]|nr:PAS domain S-box protein [Acidobacteriota bacterium]
MINASESEPTVLCVNDSPEQLKLLEARLRQAGCRVVCAADGVEALEAARREPPDLIVSDVVMPRGDGIELCRAVRADADLSHTPVLLLSAMRRDEQSVLEGLSAGADEYLEAPCSTARLVALASRLVERKRAEDVRRESEGRYRMLFERSPQPMWVYDLETLRFLAVNDAAVRHYDYTRAEFLSMTIKDIRPPAEVPALLEDISSLSVDDYTPSRAARHVKKDGAAIEVEVTGSDFGFAGRRARLIQINDVTERRRAEESLARLAAAVEQTADSIVITDAAAAIQYVNPAFERVSGYTRGETLGRNPRFLKSGKTDESVYREMWAALARGEVWAGNFVNKRKDGTFYEEHVTVSPVRDDTGQVINYIAVKQDLTQQKQLEEQLRQSQKMEAVGRLAGGIAHDFNNLLTAINGYSDLALRRLQAEDPLRKSVEEIRKAGERAAALTRQLLAFSRKQVLQPRVVSLNDVVADMNKMLRRVIGEDVELVTALDERLGHVKADPCMLEQVVLNLCVNARDAMPHGGRLSVETRDTDLDEFLARQLDVRPGPYVVLTVTDTGTGMDGETRERIFEPFFTTKGAGKGTGLGLSTVYGIVRQSGGGVRVQSEVGRGSTFEIYLPRVGAPPREYAAVRERLAPPSGAEKILLVEDDRLVRNAAREIVSAQGYEVLEAETQAEALGHCAANPDIALLLTDVVMPQVNGKELAGRLTALLPSMCVLFMSGYAETVVHDGIVEEGLNFIQKPFTPAALLWKLREVLDAPPAARNRAACELVASGGD